jgi:DNA-binding response OmpR family regulator
MDQAHCILIVDDEPNVRLVVRTALEAARYRVIEAEDGSAALARLQKNPHACDLVVLDLLMPRMDGMEFLRALRANEMTVPVVILTAHGSIPEAVEAMKLGAIDFLTKPITPDALRRAVAEVIERHTPAPDAIVPPPRVDTAPPDRSRELAFDLARAKRAINRGQFAEAESLLRELIAIAPKSTEAHELLNRLLILKEQEERGSYRILRDWFPGGITRRKSPP